MFRVPVRATVKRLTQIADTPDKDGQFETLTFQVNSPANPKLGFTERALVQIVASRRPKSEGDRMVLEVGVEPLDGVLNTQVIDSPIRQVRSVRQFWE
jgi:hypothetical protein